MVHGGGVSRFEACTFYRLKPCLPLLHHHGMCAGRATRRLGAMASASSQPRPRPHHPRLPAKWRCVPSRPGCLASASAGAACESEWAACRDLGQPATGSGGALAFPTGSSRPLPWLNFPRTRCINTFCSLPHCRSTNYVPIDGGRRCQECVVPNCRRCEAGKPARCETCAAGYQKVPSTSWCQQCLSPNCKLCR